MNSLEPVQTQVPGAAFARLSGVQAKSAASVHLLVGWLRNPEQPERHCSSGQAVLGGRNDRLRNNGRADSGQC